MSGLFLNVDVEVRSKTSLTPLREALGEKINLMYCGDEGELGFLLSFEIDEPDFVSEREPDPIADRLCQVLEQLSAPARALWDSADDRVFDIGYEPQEDRRIGQPVLAPGTMRRIGELNARLAVSIYWRG